MHLPRFLAMSLVAVALAGSGCTTVERHRNRATPAPQSPSAVERDHARVVNREQAQLRSDYARAEQPLPASR
jgi:hypothetical protein